MKHRLIYLRSLRNTGTLYANWRTTIPCWDRHPSVLPWSIFWNEPFPAIVLLLDCAVSIGHCDFPIPTQPLRVRGPFRSGQWQFVVVFTDIWTTTVPITRRRRTGHELTQQFIRFLLAVVFTSLHYCCVGTYIIIIDWLW